MTRHRHTSRGFTLIEVSVALLVAGLLLAIALPAVQSVTATQLRKSAGQISGMAREAYARAAISGKPHRVVLDLDENTFWMEMASGAFVLSVEKDKQLTEAELNEKKRTKAQVLAAAKADIEERDRLKL